MAYRVTWSTDGSVEKHGPGWIGMVWLTEKCDRFTSYFLHKTTKTFLHKTYYNWKKHMTYTYCLTINEKLNMFHQEFTLDYDCFCGYIYNSTNMDICHMCQLKYLSPVITDASGFYVTEWQFYNISKAGTYTRHQQCPKMCWLFISDTFQEHNYGAKK